MKSRGLQRQTTLVEHPKDFWMSMGTIWMSAVKARNDEWVRARPAVSSTVLLWTRDIARPKGIATEKRFLCRRGESWTGLWSG